MASTIKIRELGKVKEVKKVIAKVTGLSTFMNGQLVNFAGGTKGMIVGFAEGDILVLILGEESKVRIGEEVTCVQEEFRIPVGDNFIGRIVNSLGEPVDGKAPIQGINNYYPVFGEAPETMDRTEVDSCLETGTRIIDTIIPIAKGQRQLVLGDRMTGKTTICVDAILNQKGKDVICIYCCIGKSFSNLVKVVQVLKKSGALEYTMVVGATAATTVGEQYLAPYSASAFGEYFMRKGKDVFVVFDDMTKHAWSYRQLSLLLERPPGREAYPGDVYYIHSQLVERAGRLNEELGGGSMTFFPIVDTLQGDVTGFIPSNLISMTDGQIYLSSALFSDGFKPAIDFSLSVSIVGSKIQNPVLKELSKGIRLEYAQYTELLRLTKLKSDMTSAAEKKMRRGRSIRSVLVQDKNKPVEVCELIILLYALSRGILDEISEEKITGLKNNIWEYVTKNRAEFLEKLKAAEELTADIEQGLEEAIKSFFER